MKGQNYTDKYELQIQKTKEVEGTRGNIYDRNGVLLAYNELAYSVTIQDNGDYDKKSEKNKALNQIVTKVINIVESNGDSVINDFGIILDANSEYSFVSESDTQRLRFIADVYGKKPLMNYRTSKSPSLLPTSCITYVPIKHTVMVSTRTSWTRL